MKFFSIFIRKYGRYTTFRESVLVDKEDPRGHIVHALAELSLFVMGNNTDGVTVDITTYDEDNKDSDGETITYEWDGEPFSEFINKFLLPETKI